MAEYVELSSVDLAQRWRERPLLERVTDSVSEARGAKEYETPDAALRWLLACAWYDLRTACGEAIDGVWSIACDHQVTRIVGLTELVGPLNWEHVSVELILNGVYEQIHEQAGHPTPLTDDNRRRAQAVMDRRLS